MRERQKRACRNGPCMVRPRHTQTLEWSNLLLKPLGAHVMRQYQVHIKLIGAAVLMFAFISVSEARWFRGGYAYYYVFASPVCYAPTAQPSPTAVSSPSPAGGASAASAATTAHQVNRPADGTPSSRCPRPRPISIIRRGTGPAQLPAAIAWRREAHGISAAFRRIDESRRRFTRSSRKTARSRIEALPGRNPAGKITCSWLSLQIIQQPT